MDDWQIKKLWYNVKIKQYEIKLKVKIWSKMSIKNKIGIVDGNQNHKKEEYMISSK